MFRTLVSSIVLASTIIVATAASAFAQPFANFTGDDTNGWTVVLTGKIIAVTINPPGGGGASAAPAATPVDPGGSCDLQGNTALRRKIDFDPKGGPNQHGVNWMSWVNDLKSQGGKCHFQAGNRGGNLELNGGTQHLNPGEERFWDVNPGDQNAGAGFKVD